MKTLFSFLLPAISCFFPALWRIYTTAFSQPVGALSDFGLGCILLGIVWCGPRWLRFLLLVIWAVFHIISMELLAAVGRLPTWQDIHYLIDPTFMEKSMTGLHLSEPLYSLTFLATVILAGLVPRYVISRKLILSGPVVTGLLLLTVAHFNASQVSGTVTARYNPLHWFVADIFFRTQLKDSQRLQMKDLPPDLRTLDLQGKRLSHGNGRVKNVLIVVLEGISGIYIPEIRKAMGVAEGPFQMKNLAAALSHAMLIPDFVTHSHQTIRGIYALHCGDLSKLSSETPKGFELQLNPERADECLPAQLAKNGWDTHFLQGAPLQFMNKDKVMPAMGFQHVHGLEWFGPREEDSFIWGTRDDEFFAGARKYIQMLEQQNRPWLLSLLTVATHQPFDAAEELVQKYGSRKIAAVATLDTAISHFIEDLRLDGVLDHTLVIVTSDESHGYDGADWYGSWGFAAILAPGQEELPRLQQTTFGLVDVEGSVLDYLDLAMPPSIIGRSVFRLYPTRQREMVSRTSGKLRWQTAANRLYECSVDGNCQVSEPGSILRPQRQHAGLDTTNSGARLFALAALLDHKLTVGQENRSLQFAHGEIRPLPEKIRNEWTDNLVGAQYLDFPKDSRVAVDIRLKAIKTGAAPIQLKLILRQFEKLVETISYPQCSPLKQDEECQLQFSFTNPEARRAFSFHLLGEGVESAIQLEKFQVSIERVQGDD